MKTVILFISLFLGAGSISAGVSLPSLSNINGPLGPDDFDYSATVTYKGANSSTAEASFVELLWNEVFDTDLADMPADFCYLGTIGINDDGNRVDIVNGDGGFDIDSFIKNITRDSGAGTSGSWEANGLVYGAVVKGGSVSGLGPGEKASDVFVSELGTLLGGWSVPGGSISHFSFFGFKPIPEPSSALLGLTSVFLVGLVSRRRRRS